MLTEDDHFPALGVGGDLVLSPVDGSKLILALKVYEGYVS